MSAPTTETSLRRSQNRHSKSGNSCHHFVYHRLTCDQYDEMWARADGRCEICQTPAPDTGGRRLVVDHFESTQPRIRVIRGMLCDACNSTMSCLDGTKRWGPRRALLEPRARAYQGRALRNLAATERELVERIQERRRTRLVRPPTGPWSKPDTTEET